MPTGTVKWFNDSKGFGFISVEGDEDVFVHYTGIKGGGHRSLTEGAEVQFDTETYTKGIRAINVVVTQQPEPKADVLPSENDPRGLTGTITEWVIEKGYGFVEPDAGGDNVFLHINDLYERPDEDDDDIDLRDQRVAFDTVPEPGKKKDRAVNVVFIIDSPIMRPQPRREAPGSIRGGLVAQRVEGTVVSDDQLAMTATINVEGYDTIAFGASDLHNDLVFRDVVAGQWFYVDVYEAGGQYHVKNIRWN